MVNVEEVENDPMVEEEDDVDAGPEQELPSHERLLDAEAIEHAAEGLDRPTARLHLQALAKKLRREAEALKRMEKHAHMTEQPGSPAASPPRAAAAAPAVRASSPPRPIAVTPGGAGVEPSKHFISIDRFSFDAGGYNAPFVTLYVPLPGVGSRISKDNVSCRFTKSSFDLVVSDLDGKSYRLFRENLEKDIDPDKSKFIVKSDEVRLKLAKVPQKYGGFDYWSKLTENPEKKKKMDDPQAGLMDLMKQMYDEGDDNMKRMIGETMMKQRSGELNKEMGLDDKFKM